MAAKAKCTAKSKQTGKRCGQWPVPGAKVCRFHGGYAKQVKAAATERVEKQQAEQEARRMVDLAGFDMSPEDGIVRCIRIAAAEVEYATARISELGPEEIVVAEMTKTNRPLKEMGGAESPSARVTEATVAPPSLNIWLRFRREATDRLVQYSAVALKVGIEQRRVKLAEDQGAMMAKAISGILDELGVAGRPEVPKVVRRHLSLIAGAAA